jgi:hypothetical protein
MSELKRSALPWSRMSPPGCRFSSAISSITSPPMISVFCQVAVFMLLETTYFGMLFMRSANPLSFGAVGQNAAKISYVVRPSKMAPADMSSSILYRC